jgi:hypothetical protein
VDVRLPLKFTATPEYSPTDDGTMPVVHVHPQTEAADSSRPGKRIDSGNWFMNMGDYDSGDPNEAVKTAAHSTGTCWAFRPVLAEQRPDAQAHAPGVADVAAGRTKLDDAATRHTDTRAMGPSLSRHAVVASRAARRSVRSGHTSSRRCGRRSPGCGRTQA